ncbi:hypothetical protein AAC387_Pa04g2240 [Persea americana]
MDVASNQNAQALYLVSRARKLNYEFNFVFTISSVFLAFHTVCAIVRMREDILDVTFAISFFVFLMIFLRCLSIFDKLPKESKKKEMLKVPIWVLATALNLMFAYQVSMIIQSSMALGWLVWGMAGTSALITFYFLLCTVIKRPSHGNGIPGLCVRNKPSL